MVALKTKARALTRLQVTVPADVARRYRVTRRAQIYVPAARYLRRFAEVQRNLPAVYRAGAVVGHADVQLITAAPDVGVRHRAANTTAATARTR